jgi:hypothetical protein
MMGIKNREFAPLPREISLEELVPTDCFYRDLEKCLDLSFVRMYGRWSLLCTLAGDVRRLTPWSFSSYNS